METEKQVDESAHTVPPFDQWAIVELMGHQVIAGRVSEVLIAGKGMLRVDVPTVGEIESWTKLYSPAAIYAITPTTEAVATEAALRMRVRPVKVYTAVDPSHQIGRRGDYDEDNDY